jgi:CDP-diacylglycerol pyrophosphatase
MAALCQQLDGEQARKQSRFDALTVGLIRRNYYLQSMTTTTTMMKMKMMMMRSGMPCAGGTFG